MKRKLFLLFLLLAQLGYLFADEFPVAVNTYTMMSPVVSHDGTKYFSAYIDRRGGSSYAFYGRFISNTGEVSQNDYQVVPSHSGMSFMNHIVYGDNQYLFSWSRQRSSVDYQRDAYATLIDTAGTPVGNPFRLSTHNTISASFLSAAFDGTNYFVVWQQGMPTQGSSIIGQLVTPSGQLVGSNITIRPEALITDNSQVYPDILFDGEKYLIVWDDNRTGTRRIYGWFFNTSGEPIGDDFPIGENVSDQLLVKVAYNGVNYLAVWGDERDGSDKGIYGQYFNSMGQLIGSNIAISPANDGNGRSYPKVGTNGSNFLVSWDHETNSKANVEVSSEQAIYDEAAGVENTQKAIWTKVYGRLLGSNGEFLTDEMPIGVNQYHQSAGAVASDGEDFLCVWEDSRNGNQYYNIYGMLIDGGINTTLNPPLNLSGSYENNQVTLQWESPQIAKEFLYYRVYRNHVMVGDEINEISFTDTDIEEEMTYEYTVSAMYSEGESGFSNAIEIVIPNQTVNISFMISGEAIITKEPIPLDGVKVTIENVGEVYSNAEGIAVFTDVVIPESLNYSLEKEGYFPLTGSLNDFTNDIELELTMLIDDTSIEDVDLNALSIWPVPARDVINLNNSIAVKEVYMIDLSGKICLQQVASEFNQETIDISQLPSGLYFLKIVSENELIKVFKVIVE